MQFRVSYYEEESGYIYFEASNITEATSLIEQVERGDIFTEDLPKYFRKSRHAETDINTLEEVR